jgi:hypothetical protein
MVPGDSVAIDGVIRLDNAIEGETIGSVIRLGQNPIIKPLEVTENGTYSVPDGVEGFNPVTVHLPKAMTAEQIATGTTDWGDLVIEAEEIVPYAFDNGSDRKNCPYSSITSVMAPNLVTVGDYSFRSQTALRVVYLPKCKKIGQRAFYNTRALSILYAPLVEYIGDILLDESGETPYRNEGFRQVVFPASVTRFPTTYTLQGCVDLEVVVFMFRPNALGSTTFYQCDKLRDIYVPWLEGELPNAPWGARKATIHYNTDYGDYEWNGYVCSPEVSYPPAIQ